MPKKLEPFLRKRLSKEVSVIIMSINERHAHGDLVRLDHISNEGMPVFEICLERSWCSGLYERPRAALLSVDNTAGSMGIKGTRPLVNLLGFT